MGYSGTPQDVTGTGFPGERGRGRPEVCKGPWSLRGSREYAPHGALEQMAGSAACRMTYNRRCPLVLVQSQPAELLVTTVGEWRRRHSLRRQQWGTRAAFLTSRHQVLVQGGFGVSWRKVQGGHGSRLQKGVTPDTGESRPQDPGYGRVLPTTRKSQERSAPGKELCSASDATAKRETQCWSTAAYDARDLGDRGHAPNSREWSRLPKEEERAGTSAQGDQPQNWRATGLRNGGRQPQNWIGAAAGIF